MTTLLFEMTLDEARLVRDVMNFVGGLPESTRRGLADNVRRRLDPVLGMSPCPMPDMRGAISCTDAARTLTIFERDALQELEHVDDPAECAGCLGGCEECNAKCGAQHPLSGGSCALPAGHDGLHDRRPR